MCHIYIQYGTWQFSGSSEFFISRIPVVIMILVNGYLVHPIRACLEPQSGNWSQRHLLPFYINFCILVVYSQMQYCLDH